MDKQIKVIGCFLFAILFFGLSGGISIAQINAPMDLKAAMEMLKANTLSLGDPRAEGLNLYFGHTKMNGSYDIVDKIKDSKGCTATLFVRLGDSFIRISTNVIKDGNRAVGTPLDPDGKAIVEILRGQSFAGIVDILGSRYDTIYEPIKDASGRVIGVYYVGVLVTQ